MVKMFVFLAEREPTGVILRRGPTAWYHLIQWKTKTDQFLHGAWIKGRIYEEKCDISPDGRLLIYSVYQGSRFGTEFTDSWTAISRVPWLKALVVWPQGTTYGGGGRFIDNWTVASESLDRRLDDTTMGRIKVIQADAPSRHSTDEVPGADWCGRDHDHRLIFTRAGQLIRRVEGQDLLVADFTDLAPNPQPAPDWAGEPP